MELEKFASGLVDLKGLLRPNVLKEESQWKSWKEEFSTVGAFLGLDDFIEQCARLTKEEIEQMELASTGRSKVLYALLCTLTGPVPRSVIRTVPKHHGFEAFKALVQEFEPQGATGKLIGLVELLNPKWPPSKFLQCWRNWEADVAVFEDRQSSKIPEDIRAAIVARNAPDIVKQYLKACSADILDNYAALKKAIQSLVERDRALFSSSETVPMDIGQLQGGASSPGKGKGKPKREVICYRCGKPGHTRAECRVAMPQSTGWSTPSKASSSTATMTQSKGKGKKFGGGQSACAGGVGSSSMAGPSTSFGVGRGGFQQQQQGQGAGGKGLSYYKEDIGKKFDGTCFKCGKSGHKALQCRSGGDRRRKFNGNCNHCGKYGHKKTHCWSLEKTRRIIRKEQWIKMRKVLEQWTQIMKATNFYWLQVKSTPQD